MPTLLENCKEIFHTDNLYEVIGAKKESSAKELKKAYHKRSLAFHPDRVSAGEKDASTLKFQILGQVYSILSDEQRRTEYDETGCVDDEICIDQDQDWSQYWRLLFPEVTVKQIEEFEEKYKGSEEELEDLQRLYLSGEGDMDFIMDNMLCSTHEDETRFTQILSSLIDQKKIPAFDGFVKENAKKKKARSKKAAAEAKEAEEEAKKLKLNESENSLMAAIAQRQASRARQADDFLSQLEAKYGGSGGKKSGKKSKR